MEQDRSTYQIPSYARPEAYAFVEPKTNDIYRELSDISEEILKCREEILQGY